MENPESTGPRKRLVRLRKKGSGRSSPAAVPDTDEVTDGEGDSLTDDSPGDEFPGHEPEVEFEPQPVADEEPDFSPVEEFVPSEPVEEMKAEVSGWNEADTDEFLLDGSAEAVAEEDMDVDPEVEAVLEEDQDEDLGLEVDDQQLEDEVVVDEDVKEVTDPSPIIFGEGDPFGDETDDMATPVRTTVEPHVEISTTVDHGASLVRAGDNQLHLRLQGTGAIAESGQVRALDIEVPVPGSWVGNRRVTLQLRLTLTPVPEDDDGGPGDAS